MVCPRCSIFLPVQRQVPRIAGIFKANWFEFNSIARRPIPFFFQPAFISSLESWLHRSDSQRRIIIFQMLQNDTLCILTVFSEFFFFWSIVNSGIIELAFGRTNKGTALVGWGNPSEFYVFLLIVWVLRFSCELRGINLNIERMWWARLFY